MNESGWYRLLFVAVLALASVGLAEDKPAALTADEIAQRLHERKTGDDGRFEMEMTLTDHRGRDTR